METIHLTTAQAIVKWLLVQRTMIDGEEVALFAGAFGIFGHGNVTCLAEALEPVQDDLPMWRGHNEQSMALAAVAYAKVMRGRRIMIATSSIGPGCTNMVTAAAVAHADRLRQAAFLVSSLWAGARSQSVHPTPSTATRPWGMRSLEPGGPRWLDPATSSAGSEMAPTC